MNFTGNSFPEGGIMTTCKMPPAWTQKVDPDCHPSKCQDQLPARRTTPNGGFEEERNWQYSPRLVSLFCRSLINFFITKFSAFMNIRKRETKQVWFS